ncbi:MAG: hypothetical protein RLZZ196_183 [Bacteroidota bacterium]|jgi:hypothetical protein
MTRHSKLTIWDDSTRLSPNGLHSGTDITIQNLSDTRYVYLGGSGVSSNDFGYRLSPGAAVSFELPGTDAIYAYSDYQVDVAVLMTNLEVGS